MITVERDGRIEVGQPGRQRVRHATTVAKTHDAGFARGFRPILQNARSGYKIFPRFGLIQLGEQLTRLVFITRVPTQRCQGIRRKRYKIVQCQTSGNIFDVRVEPTVFMDDQYARQFACGIGWLGQVALDGAIAIGRREFHDLGFDALVVFRNHLCGSKVWAQ